jgi:hypothetical protein
MADAMNTVATKFPDVKFAIIDVRDQPQGQASNVPACSSRSTGGLPGRHMAGLYKTTMHHGQLGRRPESRRSTTPSPPGRRRPNPDIKTLNAYSQDFVDQGSARRSRWTRSPRARRSSSGHGQCGLGARRGQGEGRQGIGVDARPGLPRPAHHDLAEEDLWPSRPNQAGRTARSRAGRHHLRPHVDGVGFGKTRGPSAAQVQAVAQIVRRDHGYPDRSSDRSARARAPSDHQAVQALVANRDDFENKARSTRCWENGAGSRPDERFWAPPARRGEIRSTGSRCVDSRAGPSGSASAWSTSTSCSCR